MLNASQLFDLKVVYISEIKKGNMLINLGKVLEIDEHPNHTNLIIFRLNEKHVVKFGKGDMLIILDEES